MPSTLEYAAREIAKNSGYDPDQLVIPIDGDKDFDLLAIGLAPVDMTKIQPLFMKFYNEALRGIGKKEGAPQERSNPALSPA